MAKDYKTHREGGGFLFRDLRMRSRGGRKSMTINILGTAYDMEYINKPPQDLGDCAGYTDPTVREIRIVRQAPEPGAVKDLRSLEHQILRHEIIHAYLYECGLAHNSMSVDAWGAQ